MTTDGRSTPASGRNAAPQRIFAYGPKAAITRPFNNLANWVTFNHSLPAGRPPNCSTGSKLLMVIDLGPETLRERDPKKLIPPLHGALQNEQDHLHLFERLAFMARREGR